MHRLTDNRMKWGRYALLAGVSIGLLVSPLGPHFLFLIGLLGPAVVWCVALPSLDWKPYVLGLFAHQVFAWAGVVLFWGSLITGRLSHSTLHNGMSDCTVGWPLFLLAPAASGILFAVGGCLYRLSRKHTQTDPEL